MKLLCPLDQLSWLLISSLDIQHGSTLQVSKRGTVASRPDASQQPPQQQQLQTKQQPDELPRRRQDSEEVPEVVNDRMLKRIIAFSGVPVFIGFSLFPFFYFLKVSPCLCPRLAPLP